MLVICLQVRVCVCVDQQKLLVKKVSAFRPKSVSQCTTTRLLQRLDHAHLLLVDVGQQQADVGREQVVHLVALVMGNERLEIELCKQGNNTYQWRLTQQLAAPNQIADGHVEVGDTAAPVRDAGEGVRHKDLLGVRVDQTDAVLVDRHQQVLRVVGVAVLLLEKMFGLDRFC